MASSPNVRLELSNRPENVVLVREALTGVAEAIGLDGTDLSDIRTAVTEACNNVVLHAYAGEEGPVEVEVRVLAGTFEVTVRDRGVGLDLDAVTSGSNEPGIGLPVIGALTRDVEFARPQAGTGTEVRMEFETPAVPELEPVSGEEDVFTLSADMDDETTTRVCIGPTSLARTVLPRVLSVLAARAELSTDRISDAQLLADALAAHAGRSIDGSHIAMAVSARPRELNLRVGPLIAGRGEQLILDSDLGGLGPVLGKLADSHGVTRSDDYDILTLQLSEPG
jgi:anti-sigma regulatory factor (Ser/Thr protein kinase)